MDRSSLGDVGTRFRLPRMIGWRLSTLLEVEKNFKTISCSYEKDMSQDIEEVLPDKIRSRESTPAS